MTTITNHRHHHHHLILISSNSSAVSSPKSPSPARVPPLLPVFLSEVYWPQGISAFNVSPEFSIDNSDDEADSDSDSESDTNSGDDDDDAAGGILLLAGQNRSSSSSASTTNKHKHKHKHRNSGRDGNCTGPTLTPLPLGEEAQQHHGNFSDNFFCFYNHTTSTVYMVNPQQRDVVVSALSLLNWHSAMATVSVQNRRRSSASSNSSGRDVARREGREAEVRTQANFRQGG